MKTFYRFFTTSLLLWLIVYSPCYLVSGQAQGQITCGCEPQFCNSTANGVLNRLTGNVTCVERIEYLMNIELKDQIESCTEVAEAFPDVCGPLCHPVKCRAEEPDYCGCNSCTDAELDQMAGNFNCRQRIRALQAEEDHTEIEACREVSDTFIAECGGQCHPDKCDGRREAEFCGCKDCTVDVLNQLAGNDGITTCADRIVAARQENSGLTEQAACELVAEQYPRECGPQCDPRKCDGQKPAMCNCEECTDDILDLETSKGGTCFERMKDTWDALGVTEDDACLIVSEDLPRECGPKCHPVKCDGKAPAYCSCDECTDFDLDLVADGFTCYQRIQAHQDEDGFNENDACRAVGTFFPEICGPKCHPDKCDGGPTHCGCFNCTEAIWNTDTDGFTCGERIQGLISQRVPEIEACRQISEKFPDACGPGCHPDKCDGQAVYCDCEDCTEQYWNSRVGDFTCGERVRGLQIRQDLGLNENDACKIVSEEFPVTCGPNCNPERCDGRGAALCGCADCTEDVWGRTAGNFTCLGRILALFVEDDPDTRRRYTEEKACTVVSNQFMDICGPACHPDKCDGKPRYCGCQDCTFEVWNATAGRNGATCGSRILYLQTFDGGELTESEACTQVSREYPRECGFACNPSTCDGRGPTESGAAVFPFLYWLALATLLAPSLLQSFL